MPDEPLHIFDGTQSHRHTAARSGARGVSVNFVATDTVGPGRHLVGEREGWR